MIRQSRFEINAERFVKDEFVFPETHVLSTVADWNHAEPKLTVTLFGRPLPQDSLLLALTAKMKFYGLQNARLDIVQGTDFDMADRSDESNSSIRDIFQLTQSSLAQKQATIDSLRAVVASVGHADSIAATIIPELRVVFPQVSDIAIARPVMAQADSKTLDTLNIALVKFERPVNHETRRKLAEYLSARIGIDSLQIVNLN